MSRHRRARTGPFVRRSAYLDLWHRYEALLADYRALEADNALLIGVENTDGLPDLPAARGQLAALGEALVTASGLTPANLRIVINPGRHDEVRTLKANARKVKAGDVVRLSVGGGGGFGEVSKRSREDIAYDIVNGFITEDFAKTHYGYEAPPAEGLPSGKERTL